MPIHGYPGNIITANPTAPTSSVASGVWTTEQQLAAVAAGNWPFTIPTQQISRSLRFNRADTPSLSRTPGSAGNRQKFTISVWYKACGIGTSEVNANIINAGGDGSTLAIGGTGAFGATYNDRMFFREAGTTLFYWPMVFRDPSAWYHIVFAMDTTQATAANRSKLYVNGVDQGAFSGTAITQNTSTSINNTSAHSIGLFNGSYPNNLYYAEYYLIDGQQLAASSFGQYNAATGIWEPIAYTGTYGTNGFYVNFSDNSNTTAATLGKDYSGNGNNWTPNNFSVTAGSGNDSLVDTPTSYGTDTGAGGEVRGNYATLNPLNKNTSGTLSNGNLEWQASTTAVQVVTGTSTIIPSDKTYFEVNVVTAAGASNYYQLGIVPFGKSLTTDIGVSSGNGYAIEQNGNSDIRLRLNGTSVTVSTVVQTGDVLQVAVDYATGKLWFGRNNTWYNSSGGTTGNPGAGTNETATISTTTDWFPAVAKYNTGGSYAINFGQRPFAYTAPSGFKALCTQNLPTPTIGATSTTQAGKYFNTILWTATDAASRAITGVGFQPDFLWAKTRNTAGVSHRLYDAVRGATTGSLVTDSTAAEDTTAGQLTSFNVDGFTTGTNKDYLNFGSRTYVAWNWKANGAGSSNTAGTITSTVSANTTSGFSIVTFTAPSSGAFTVGHGLGVAPKMYIMKSRSNAYTWGTYHESIGNTGRVDLNSTSAVTTTQNSAWNNTSPTSTVFSVGSDWAGAGITYVAYCFAAVAGYSAFGSYTGNGSTDGPFVYTGFRPAYVLIKYSSSTADWIVLDKSRPGYNVIGGNLYPNLSNAEDTQTKLDLTSNGFKIRADGTNANVNVSSGTYIYAAFAESPFKYSLAR